MNTLYYRSPPRPQLSHCANSGPFFDVTTTPFNRVIHYGKNFLQTCRHFAADSPRMSSIHNIIRKWWNSNMDPKAHFRAYNVRACAQQCIRLRMLVPGPNNISIGPGNELVAKMATKHVYHSAIFPINKDSTIYSAHKKIHHKNTRKPVVLPTTPVVFILPLKP